MKAGFAQANVTPPLGMAMEGLGQPHGCESVHDDLFVRALYLAHAQQEVLILGYDLLFFERPDIERFKQAIRQRTGLAPEQILINTSHNHAGPRLTHWNYSDGPDAAYLDRILKATVEAAVGAKASLRDVTVTAGKARTRIPVSRRKLDADGKAQWAPYPEGTICDALPFCLLRDQDDRVVSLLFSVSCHPSMIYECIISAEYPGAAMRQLNRHFGTDGAMFLQGTGGDTKPRPIAVGNDHWRHGTWDEMEAVGGEITQAIVEQVGKGLIPVEPDLRTCVVETEWPLEGIPPRGYFEALLKDPKKRASRRAWASDMLAQMDRHTLSRAARVGVHALQLGRGVRLIGIEGEAVGELGNFILKVYNKGVTFPLGYTDGCQIYLPVSRMLPEGGYETDSYWEYHYPAPLAKGGEVVLKEPLLELQKDGIIPL